MFISLLIYTGKSIGNIPAVIWCLYHFSNIPVRALATSLQLSDVYITSHIYRWEHWQHPCSYLMCISLLIYTGESIGNIHAFIWSVYHFSSIPVTALATSLHLSDVYLTSYLYRGESIIYIAAFIWCVYHFLSIHGEISCEEIFILSFK